MDDAGRLSVVLHGRTIGSLTRFAGDRTIFAFTQAYAEDADRLPLGLGFKDSFGDLITTFRPVQKRVMPFFSNLLPEGSLRGYLARRAGVNPEREFALLQALGRDLPGAVRLEPAKSEAGPLAEARGEEGGHPVSEPKAPGLAFSLAGVQLKFSAVAEVGGRLTIPASGAGGGWIVKLPSRDYPGLPENEFSMMTLASKIGMDVPTIDLVDIAGLGGIPEDIDLSGGKAFVIKRFDRPAAGARVHAEDFAQIFGVYPEDKYKTASARSIARVIAAEATEADVIEFVRRLTFNTLIGNGDMHLKNWSLIYPDRRRPALAPAYDFVSTIPYIPGDRAALKVSRSKAFGDFTQEELSHLAAKAVLPEHLILRTARETVGLFHQHWAAEKTHLPLYPAVIAAIDRHLQTLPIARS
ncbi:kinase [Rhodospirillum rubrum]|uniref:type II toxin-antitoxin system HipA family toxin n=1 Tax=Rhodospirillum rubrum TaxID=1085 RepID=UPI0019042431|nr:HipA domain-containing protein [Rhodospirillum rubrum]MBK1664295.1 kinase [Rhodospirillum rubrum]MBK1675910.1 kinase [Rhodospirillum rubrum]